MRKPRGFTIVELLTALAIMAVGMALAAPMITNLVESSRLTSAANNIVESIALARSEAVRQRTITQVVPLGADWKDGWAVQNNLGAEIARFDAIASSLTLSASEDVANIQFLASGTRTLGSPQVTLTLCASSGRGRLIDIGIAGTTSVEQIDAGCGE